jgi:hypothetical protein
VTLPEVVLVGVFAAVWAVPLALALAWERRCRSLVARSEPNAGVERA